MVQSVPKKKYNHFNLILKILTDFKTKSVLLNLYKIHLKRQKNFKLKNLSFIFLLLYTLFIAIINK